jgi:hypothetical protein
MNGLQATFYSATKGAKSITQGFLTGQRQSHLHFAGLNSQLTVVEKSPLSPLFQSFQRGE